ncbi:MAG: 16S rRNA (guanine966-N2)-methyltransferase [Methylophagaceae bacterium]
MAKLNKHQYAGQLRIIGGKWRGRKLNFPDVEGLRPTPDRVRETLFNWLQDKIGNARCLDLFAGSGAFGFEAASRGAESVTMVESDPVASKQLQSHCQLLTAANCNVESKTAQQFLISSLQQFDIVFIDPPYKSNLWSEIAAQLMTHAVLADNAYIYLECPTKDELPILPAQWHIIKDKKAGGVRYCLFTHNLGDTV